MSSTEAVLQIYLLFFYTSVVGLRADYAGYALGLAVLWDAVTDPVMGFVSDRTRSRWGKRRPWILLGSFALALAFAALFSPPNLDSQFSKFLYLIIAYMGVNTAMTLAAIPHAALGGELSFERDERTELFGWRMLFRYGGFLLAVILLGLFSGGEGAEGMSSQGATRFAMVIGVVAILAAVGTVYAVGKRDRPAVIPTHVTTGGASRILGFLRANWSAVRNPVFLPLLLAFIVAQAGRTINASLALPYYTVRLGLAEQDVFLYVLVLFMFIAAPAIAVWVWLARRFGKKWPAFGGALSLGLLTSVMYLVMPAGKLWPPMLFAAGIGGFLISSAVLFDALVADIVDYDELKSGEHREGLYFGVWMLATKFARALGLAATGHLLAFTGYQEGATEQAPEVGWRLTLLFGPGVGVCFVIAAVIFMWMPLSDEKHRRIQALLERRAKRG